MIKYRLHCPELHEFEAWFSNITNYENQTKSGHLSCPICGSSRISKAIMAPAITRSSKKSPESKISPKLDKKKSQELGDLVRKLHTALKKNAEYVGPRFPEEARRIHYDETSPRGIYGEATSQEVSELNEEGIEVLMIPKLPEDNN